MEAFLAATEAIDWRAPSVRNKAVELAAADDDAIEVTRRCFRFVRDEIKHCWDHRLEPVTYKASEVLHHGSGWCFAKSHLLAALLRANGIPSGLCYQRLSIDDLGAPYSLHGLNAVYLPEIGWHRLDARGNKPGVDARFSPPEEHLAFPIRLPGERDLPEVWPDPHPAVINCLTTQKTNQEVFEHLPDITLL